jgi:hypothetical protein
LSRRMVRHEIYRENKEMVVVEKGEEGVGW